MSYKLFNIWNVLEQCDVAQNVGGDATVVRYERPDSSRTKVTITFSIVDDKFDVLVNDNLKGIFSTKGKVWGFLS